MEIDALNQQGPIARRKALQIRGAERSLGQRPAPARVPDQPRLDIIAAGKREELGSAEQALKAAHGLPHQQRLFLPVLAQKYRDAQSAEKPVDR